MASQAKVSAAEALAGVAVFQVVAASLCRGAPLAFGSPGITATQCRGYNSIGID